MKKISISLETIKASKGAVSIQTGQFNKVLPYYLRQIEDVASQLFIDRLDNTNTQKSAPLEEGRADE